MLDGLDDDLETVAYQDDEQLHRYCYRVAGTAGLACLWIWGLREGADPEQARELALRRGKAFQRTNILRDFAQDYDATPSRVYIPADAFSRRGLTPAAVRAWERHDDCAALVLEQAAMTREHYKASDALESLIDPECSPTLWAMTRIYSGLLELIEREPQRIASDRRIRLTGTKKASIARRARPCGPRWGAGKANRVAGVNGTSSVVQHRSGAPGSVLVVGGGIAGVSCALRLAESGIPVTLLETRKKLGGRATSFLDARSGRVLDNCQHVVLGCCTNYLDLLDRLGAAEKIRWYREQYWIEEGGRTSVISRGPLPAPAHFTMSLLRPRCSRWARRSMLARACSAIMRSRSESPSKRDLRNFPGSMPGRTSGSSDASGRRWWSAPATST